MKNRIVFSSILLGASVALAATGCGDDDSDVCDPLAQSGCDDGQVCETVTGGEPACFAPLVVRGRVFALADDSAVAGARVVPMDENDSPAGSVAISGTDGSYELRVPTTRTADGTPEAGHITLRADAEGYQSFPSGVRQALPIDTTAATLVDDRLVVDLALTDIGLIALAADAGKASIAGSVEVPENSVGVLVVADVGGVGYTAIADTDGDYAIFNLPGGDYTVTAYAQGGSWAPETVTLAADEDKSGVDLALDGAALGEVDGTIQLVDPGDGVTSVLLVVESTFNENLVRGSAPPGLRVPGPGLPPDVTGTYHFSGVPAGRYVILAAFENDAYVRDPSLIGGTSILHIDVVGGQVTTVGGFKVTGSLDVISPGADAPTEVTGTPTFSWVDDSSEDQYVVACYDAFGEEVWKTTMDGVSGGDPSIEYGGAALEPAMYYQFRVTSMKAGVPLSRTEDLRGVFFTPAAP